MYFLNFLKQKSGSRNNFLFVCVLMIGLVCSSKSSHPSTGDGLDGHLPVIFRNGILERENSFNRCLLGNRRLRYGQNEISAILLNK